MGFFEVKAFKCEWCGRLFESDKNYHSIECRYDPAARTCVSCIYRFELVGNQDIPNTKYCPRRKMMFVFPCERYCCEHSQDPNFEPLKKKG